MYSWEFQIRYPPLLSIALKPRAERLRQAAPPPGAVPHADLLASLIRARVARIVIVFQRVLKT